MNDIIIAIVDDEPDILDLIEHGLVNDGYKVLKFNNGTEFIKFNQTIIPDLVILDIMLPDLDGEEICRMMKSNELYSNIPVMMLTARHDVNDKVRLLNIGADDYMTKPFSTRELNARVGALLRIDSGNTRKKSFGDYLEIYFEQQIVTVRGKQIHLTPTEFKILSLFTKNLGHIFSRDKILGHLGNSIINERTVDVHIKNLREKLGIVKHSIKNIRSYGYKMDID